MNINSMKSKHFPAMHAKNFIKEHRNLLHIKTHIRLKNLFTSTKFKEPKKDYLEQYIIFPRETKVFASLCLFYEAEDITE